MVFSNKPKRSVLCIIFGLLLASCATKPQLETASYDSVALAFVEAHICGVSGKISPDTALWAKRTLYGSISGYNYDNNYLNSRVAAIANANATQPTHEDCNNIAMITAEYKQRVQENNAVAQANQRALDAQIQNMMPINTSCTKIGTQTFCNSY